MSMPPDPNDHRIDTRLIHAGEPHPRIEGAVSIPVFQSAMYVSADEESYHDIPYIRLNNTPNHRALHAKLAALENAEAAVVTSSGMAAITTSLLTVLAAGDHLLVQENLYGGTHGFITKDLGDFGIEFSFIDSDRPDSWAEKLRPTTRAVYVESMANPLLQVGDLEAVVAFAKDRGLVSLIDNTFPSPMNFRPPECGFDLSLHSGTKYLNGHSDIVAGAVIGRQGLVGKVKQRLDHLGGSLDPHACMLLHRGVKTLALRIRHQNRSALELSRFLEGHEAVDRVHYPGLASHPNHARARALFDGFGGMLSFELEGGLEASRRFLDRVTIPVVAPSLGGVETLLTRPATTSHSGMRREDRHRAGVTDSLIRVSVGIEATEDLLVDFDRALRV